MHAYESSAHIDAAPETVWSVITDAERLTDWDSGIVRIEGRIDRGERLEIVSVAAPERTFKLRVTRFEPPRSMEWSGGMPLGLFRGVRTFTLTPAAGGATDVTVREEYSGPLLGMIWKSMPDLQPSFDTYTSGLKARAESIEPSSQA